MPISNFKFSSAAVKFNELDKSQKLAEQEDAAPVIIGLSSRGPAYQPIKVSSFSEFVEIFGEPQGGGQSGDVWRDGNFTAPFYAPYAAQSWLENGSGLTFIRLLGSSHSERTSAGYSGWSASDSMTSTTEGGSFGLFVFPSGSFASTSITGSLAAIWYCTDCHVRLSSSLGTSTAMMVNASDALFTAVIQSGSTELAKKVFSLSPSSPYFIRKVFNTNPQNTNSNLSDTTNAPLGISKYWLGETFENDFSKELYSGSVAYTGSGLIGSIFGLVDTQASGTPPFSNHKNVDCFSSIAKTGWFICQDLVSGANASFSALTQQRLFRFTDRYGGDWLQNHAKISLTNIRVPQNEKEDQWPTFDVVLRKIDDTDGNVKILEKFVGCNLNPSSENYLAKKVGTQFFEYDESASRWNLRGEFPNQSKYFLVDMNPDLETSPNVALVPFGCIGPNKYVATSQTTAATFATSYWIAASGSSYLKGVAVAATGSEHYNTASIPTGLKMKAVWPSIRTRTSSSVDNLPSVKMAYWGAWTHSTETGTAFNKNVVELVREGPSGVNLFGPSSGAATASVAHEPSFTFTLDDIKETGSSNKLYFYSSGAKVAGTSVTAYSGSKELLNRGIGKFTTLFYGGSNGWDIKESLPVANRAIAANPTVTTSAIFNAYKKAFDLIRDPEEVPANLICVPGLTNSGLTNRLIDIAEERQDSLCIMDLEYSFYPPHEIREDALDPNSDQYKYGNKDSVVDQVNVRAIDSTYVASYFPWIQIRDNNGQLVWIPPSIPALGAMAFTDKTSGPWFSPAGLNRGGLSQQTVGLHVLSVALKMNEKDRDDLQTVNVNPIAKFPKNGIAIWGQKTMTPKQTGLNRVNVRRLCLYIKEKVGNVLQGFIFEPNVKETWEKASKQVNPILDDIKARLGVVDAKFILDESTTTPDLIDQNIMYAKILIKPAKAIEYIAVDLVIVGSNEQI